MTRNSPWPIDEQTLPPPDDRRTSRDALRAPCHRWIRAGLIAFLAAALSLGGYLFQDLLVPVRVASGSMGSCLPGPHWRLCCPECQLPFSVGTDTSHGTRVVCPNCGNEQLSLGLAPMLAGQRVLVNRAILLLRELRRWDLVVARHPREPEALVVKRIVGLPGEDIGFRRGDLYVNGRRHQKSVDQLRAVAVLVHDDSFRPSLPSCPRGWSAVHPRSRWRTTPHGYVFDGLTEVTPTPRHKQQNDSRDWLTYMHGLSAFGGTGQGAAPILDDYAYNQGISRTLNVVRDLLLTATLDVRGAGTVRFGVSFEDADFDVRWHTASGRVKLVGPDGSVVAEASLAGLEQRPCRVSLMTCDARLELNVGDRGRLTHDFGREYVPTPAPFRLAASDGLHLTVRELRVWRDLHLLHANGSDADWTLPTRLGADQYLLVGDNLPVSRDGRHPERFGCVSRSSILGGVVCLGKFRHPQ